MADTTTGTSAPNAGNNTPEAESFDLYLGLADLFCDINDTVLAIREMLEAADPTDLSVILLDTLRLLSLRCEIGQKLASQADIEYTQTDIKILDPHTAKLCGL